MTQDVTQGERVLISLTGLKLPFYDFRISPAAALPPPQVSDYVMSLSLLFFLILGIFINS
jgi:hypothetical protein